MNIGNNRFSYQNLKPIKEFINNKINIAIEAFKTATPETQNKTKVGAVIGAGLAYGLKNSKTFYNPAFLALLVGGAVIGGAIGYGIGKFYEQKKVNQTPKPKPKPTIPQNPEKKSNDRLPSKNDLRNGLCDVFLKPYDLQEKKQNIIKEVKRKCCLNGELDLGKITGNASISLDDKKQIKIRTQLESVITQKWQEIIKKNQVRIENISGQDLTWLIINAQNVYKELSQELKKTLNVTEIKEINKDINIQYLHNFIDCQIGSIFKTAKGAFQPSLEQVTGTDVIKYESGKTQQDILNFFNEFYKIQKPTINDMQKLWSQVDDFIIQHTIDSFSDSHLSIFLVKLLAKTLDEEQQKPDDTLTLPLRGGAEHFKKAVFNVNEFINSVNYITSCNLKDIAQEIKNNRDIKRIVPINSGSHWASLIIIKNQEKNDYSVTHINSLGSSPIKEITFKSSQELNKFMHNIQKENMYEDANRTYNVDNFNQAMKGAEVIKDFQPLIQSNNICHQMAVLNGLKYMEHLESKKELDFPDVPTTSLFACDMSVDELKKKMPDAPEFSIKYGKLYKKFANVGSEKILDEYENQLHLIHKENNSASYIPRTKSSKEVLSFIKEFLKIRTKEIFKQDTLVQSKYRLEDIKNPFSSRLKMLDGQLKTISKNSRLKDDIEKTVKLYRQKLEIEIIQEVLNDLEKTNFIIKNVV